MQTVANFTVSSRIPPAPREFHIKNYIRPFKNKSYRLLCLSMLMYLGLFLPTTYIILQAQQEGMSAYLAGKLVVVINAVSCKLHLWVRETPWGSKTSGLVRLTFFFDKCLGESCLHGLQITLAASILPSYSAYSPRSQSGPFGSRSTTATPALSYSQSSMACSPEL